MISSVGARARAALSPALALVVAAAGLLCLNTAMAQQATASADTTAGKKADVLEEVVVTGSLIPQVRAETSTPVAVITAEDLQTRGFANVADALQHSALATGAIQGPQFSGGFTVGAQTISLFGLSPSYTKFLIDGRPIADYPALYNGTDIIVSISGIPTLLVDHIDILPGGQSSIYGSDAIAGVVNIVLKKQMDGPEADVRYGWTKDGGGTERRIGIADGFTVGDFKAVFSGQYERTNPIWGYQRPLTNQYFAGGSSPQTAERDWLVFGLFGQPNGDTYYFEDPTNCANVASQFGGSVGLRTRGGRGQYCGTYQSGYYTINNGTESTQGSMHLSYDVNDHIQLFSDVLLDHDVATFNPGTAFFNTADDSSTPYYYYEDPNVAPGGADYLNLQRIFSPEEAGNLDSQNNKNTMNSIRATVGIQGSLWSSDWKYIVDMTYTENKLTEATHLAFADAINNFFGTNVFGPNLGIGPGGDFQFAVNYPAFYKPLTPAQYASFTGYLYSYSRTEDSLARAQLTNSSLFDLPGGKAGIALMVEGGGQGWDYAPDPSFLNGQAYLYTATAGSGHRSRTAETVELRLPVVKMVTFDISNRYDDYKVAGEHVSKDTYNIGVEFRPLDSLLLRGRYGTAFKSPTLSDEFQGASGYFTTGTDYYTCTKAGYTAATLSNCPQANEGIQGSTSGNPRLQPINAKVLDFGVAWTPIEHLSVTVDFMRWNITNEVQQQDSDLLLRTDSACLLGQLNIASPSCVEALALVQRDANGLIVLISTPKINVAEEALNVGLLQLHYILDTGAAGVFTFEGQYSDILKHYQTLLPGDLPINLLQDPFYSTEFKTKENLSIDWQKNKFGAAVYVERYGRTPNYLSQQTVSGYAAPGAGTVGTWTVANLSAKYELSPGLILSGNAVNVFNKMPPSDNSQPGIANQPFNLFNYNNYGRSYFVDVSYKFRK
jgi:iron complex outermembrane receptor protein